MTTEHCETCNGRGYINTTVYSHPTIKDGTERVERCDDCHNTKKVKPVEYSTNWIITDPDCNQRCRQLAPLRWEFEEDQIADPLTGTTETVSCEIDLTDYVITEMIEACLPFGYDEGQVEDWFNNGKNLELIAECIFETS